MPENKLAKAYKTPDEWRWLYSAGLLEWRLPHKWAAAAVAEEAVVAI